MSKLHPMDPKRGRSGRPYRRLRNQVLQPGAICWWCNGMILYGLRRSHRLGPSLDHVIPLDLGGDPLNPANARPAHQGCNCSRGATLAQAIRQLGKTMVLANLRGNPRWLPGVVGQRQDHYSDCW